MINNELALKIYLDELRKKLVANIESLHKLEEERRVLLNAYQQADKELAMIDGRFRVVEIEKSVKKPSQNVKKDAAKYLKSLSEAERAMFIQELMEDQTATM